MNPLKGFTTALRSRSALFDPQFAALGGLGGVESVTRESIGERGQGAAPIDLGLGAFRLSTVEDAGQFGDLAFVQIEFCAPESQRPADAETAAAKGVVVHLFRGTVAPPMGMLVTGVKGVPTAAPEHDGWKHDLLLSRGVVRTRGDFVRGPRASRCFHHHPETAHGQGDGTRRAAFGPAPYRLCRHYPWPWSARSSSIVLIAVRRPGSSSLAYVSSMT